MPEWKTRNTRRARSLRRQATPAERTLWQYLARSQCGAKFSRELQLVVELDGFSHDLSPAKDAQRDAWMRGEGFTVLRFTNTDVSKNAEGVALAIRQQVQRLKEQRA